MYIITCTQHLPNILASNFIIHLDIVLYIVTLHVSLLLAGYIVEG